MSSVEAEATFFSQGVAPSAYMVLPVILTPYSDPGLGSGWDSNPDPSTWAAQQQQKILGVQGSTTFPHPESFLYVLGC